MSAKDLLSLVPLLSDPVTLAIVAYLSSATEKVSFSELLTQLELTKGNLSTHLRNREDVKLVLVEKSFKGRRPLTVYEISPLGRKSLKNLRKQMESLLVDIK